jgi:formate hydrogenlyase subunit 6/NADH:ubiquinone oxidoreductase subunit I
LKDARLLPGFLLQVDPFALEIGEADPEKPKLRKVKVNPVLCAGCSMCQQVCTYNAVEEKVL